MAHYVQVFAGANYKAEPHLLESGEGQEAVNCFFEDGSLGSYREPAYADTARWNSETIYRFADQYWFQWPDDVDVAKGAIPSDTENRTYYTGDGPPKMTYAGIATSGFGPYPTVSYNLGVPPSDVPPVVTVQGQADDEEDTPESRSYVVTYVTHKGEEGPPGPPTSIVEVMPGQTVTLESIPAPPTGAYNIQTTRIYRTASAAGDTSFLFVAEIAAGVATYTDTKATEALGEVIPSVSWDPPPEDMKGLVALPNGVMAGFRGKDLCLSEPYRPHAWPIGYRLQTDYPIVAISPFAGGLVVATTGTPYIVSAEHPAAASMAKIERPRGCVSKRGMVDMGQYAIFPTRDGLLLVAPGQSPALITEAVLTLEQWRSINPETIHAYRWYNRYVAFYQGAYGPGGFILNPQGGEFTFLDMSAGGGYSDPETGRLYLIRSGNIEEWDAGYSRMTYRWASKVFLEPKENAMTAIRVDAESYPVEVEVHSDGDRVDAITVVDDRAHRIHPHRGKRWWILIEDTSRVRMISLAENVAEAV